MSRSAKLFSIIVVILLAASAVMQVESGNAGDKNWLLLAAKLLLQGKKLSVDIFEVNPPLVIWLYTIPVWLSQQMPSLADFEWLALIGLTAILCAAMLSARLIARHAEFAGWRAQWGFGLLVASTLLFFTTQVYFFDRDHIFFVLTFPYMLRFMPSLTRRNLPLRLRVAIGLLAAVGFCIKPVTLVVFSVIQLLFILRERRFSILWSVENLIIYLGGILYLFCIWHFTPDYIRAVMPIALATYSAYNRRINGLLYLSIAFISAGLTFAELRLSQRSPYRRDTWYFIGVNVACLLYALSGNGWGYTYNPLLCMLLFTGGWVALEYRWLARSAKAEGRDPWPFLLGEYACLTNLGINAAYMILCLFMFFFTVRCDKYLECRENEPFLDYVNSHHVRSFGTFSMNLRRWTTLVRESGASWDTRFNHLWMLPQILSDREGQRKYQWIIEYMGRAYGDDLNNHRPEVVFVDKSDGIFAWPHPVDMVGLFMPVAEFREAWQHYRYVDSIDLCVTAEEKAKSVEDKNNSKVIPIHIDCRFSIYSRLPEATH